MAKYDALGTLQWTKQLGTSSDDYSYSVAVDGPGNAFISGFTRGSLGGRHVGGYFIPDAFLAKYDASGTLQWTDQLATSGYDTSYSVAVDGAGNAFISWISDFHYNAFLAKYDASGKRLWTKKLGTAGTDVVWSVAVDNSGNAFISGYTDRSLGGDNAGSNDAFLAKYDTSGTLQWTKQLGTSNADESYSVAVDDAGNAFISGYTEGSLGGPNVGRADAFLAKYDTSGVPQWTRQLGTSGDDESWSVAVDGSGNAFISGKTTGSLGGPNAGGWDAFLAKLSPVPEPGTFTLAMFALVGLAALGRRRR